MQSPSPSAAPWLHAAAKPRFTSFRTSSRGCSSDRRSERDSSVEALSTTVKDDSSNSDRCAADTARTHSARYAPAFQFTITTSSLGVTGSSLRRHVGREAMGDPASSPVEPPGRAPDRPGPVREEKCEERERQQVDEADCQGALRRTDEEDGCRRDQDPGARRSRRPDHHRQEHDQQKGADDPRDEQDVHPLVVRRALSGAWDLARLVERRPLLGPVAEPRRSLDVPGCNPPERGPVRQLHVAPSVLRDHQRSGSRSNQQHGGERRPSERLPRAVQPRPDEEKRGEDDHGGACRGAACGGDRHGGEVGAESGRAPLLETRGRRTASRR